MSTLTVSPGLVSLRRAVPADREALTLMYRRCSPATGYLRFHGPLKTIPEPYLTEALSGSGLHYSLVACAGADEAGADEAGADEAGTVVALASCRAVAEGMAELGVLVEDAWQRHGIGLRLLRDLVARARADGFRVLVAQVLAEQRWIADVLRRYGACQARMGPDGVLSITVRLLPLASAS
jgi:GNAT superfamily N-acetyltransferase